MTYKHNTPTFNVNRKVVNFKDFSKDIESEKEELNKIKRQNKPNSERQQLIGGERAKYNKVTHKLDRNFSPDIVKGKIDAIEELEESKMYENQIHIPEEYSGVRMELGESTSPQDIIDLYNNYVEEGVPLVSYSEYGTEGKFYNEDDDEIPTDVILDELNYSIVGDESIEESKVFETRIDDEAYHKLIKLSSYRKMVNKFREAINEFQDSAEGVYDDGDSDQLMAFASVIQDALDEAQ